MPTPRRRFFRAVPVAVAIGLIALLTLEPRPRQAPLSAATPWHCLVCGPVGTVDVLLNVALFVPLGFTLFRVGYGPLTSALIGLGVSSLVELLQATIVAGRDPSLSDLLTNTLGTGLGALLAHTFPRLVRPDRKLAARLATGIAMGWLAMLGFTGWAVQANLPTTGLTLRRTPVVPNFDRFPGDVRRLKLNGADHEPGRLAGELDPAASAPIALDAEGTLRGWPGVTAPIADLVDGRWNTVALLGQLGQKITFTVRARSELVKLRAPSAKVYRAMPPPRGQMFSAGGRLEDGSLVAHATVEGTRHVAETRLTPGLGWMLVLPLGFYPFDYLPELTSAIWTALPLLLLGYWTRSSRLRPSGAAMLLGMTMATGLGAIPPLTGSARQGWEATTACAVALLLGWMAARYASTDDSTTAPPSARRAASP